jgi:hypothetical protein
MTTKKQPLPNRGSLDKAIQAIASVAEASNAGKGKIQQKTIAVRINAADYNRLNALFALQGTKLTAACRASLFHLAELVENGDISIPNGIIRDHRRRPEPSQNYPTLMQGKQREGIHGIFTQTPL